MISIDPGMHTGWAYWEDGELADYGQYSIKHDDLGKDLHALFQDISMLFARLKPDRILVEFPNMWAGSAVSAAASASGDLLKLAAMVGGIMALGHEIGSTVSIVLPAKWKGQLDKDAVKVRVKRSLGIDEKSSHMNDAIGIGLWALGKFRIENKSRPFS
jgi:Holliday junction resolvasome RuvABC endonuclease subunit